MCTGHPLISVLKLRPISLLRLSLLRSLDSKFPGRPLRAWEFPPLRTTTMLESVPATYRISVQRVAAPPEPTTTTTTNNNNTNDINTHDTTSYYN